MGLHETTAQHEQVLAQLNEERVSALVRISKTLESLLTQLQQVRARVAAADGEMRTREITTYNELRRQAARYRWYLEVQRESLGLRHHHRLDEFYKVPPEL